MSQDAPIIIQTSTDASLILSLLGPLALLVGVVVTYFLTQRLEHRKWLRACRIDAYVAFFSSANEVLAARKQDGETFMRAMRQHMNAMMRAELVAGPEVHPKLEAWSGDEYNDELLAIFKVIREELNVREKWI
ncbi:hypothetical protein [Glycomyces sp. NPDC021274]|uniref:hypothetical protein n=1 Tax=Glycomyces sp. NPDC021274 TaxID=3155120 RepID=UPI0033E3C101